MAPFVNQNTQSPTQRLPQGATPSPSNPDSVDPTANGVSTKIGISDQQLQAAAVILGIPVESLFQSLKSSNYQLSASSRPTASTYDISDDYSTHNLANLTQPNGYLASANISATNYHTPGSTAFDFPGSSYAPARDGAGTDVNSGQATEDAVKYGIRGFPEDSDCGNTPTSGSLFPNYNTPLFQGDHEIYERHISYAGQSASPQGLGLPSQHGHSMRTEHPNANANTGCDNYNSCLPTQVDNRLIRRPMGVGNQYSNPAPVLDLGYLGFMPHTDNFPRFENNYPHVSPHAESIAEVPGSRSDGFGFGQGQITYRTSEEPIAIFSPPTINLDVSPGTNASNQAVVPFRHAKRVRYDPETLNLDVTPGTNASNEAVVPFRHAKRVRLDPDTAYEVQPQHSTEDQPEECSTQPTQLDQPDGHIDEFIDAGTECDLPSRARFNAHDKAETAQTRGHHACIRCRHLKMRCLPDPDDPAGVCLRCKRLRKPTLFQLPCLRLIITDASLHREQKAPYQLFSQRWQSMDIVNITEWASSSVREIELTQVFLNAPYRVNVRQFLPRVGDMLEEQWHDGVSLQTHPIPPYAIADMEETADMFDHWITDNIGKYIACAVWNTEHFDLINVTYFQALKQCGIEDGAKTKDERDLLNDALKLWVACRKTSHPERICGTDTLGASQCDHPKSPWFNHIPMPPIMIAQFECIMYTRFLRPLSISLLRTLQRLVLANKRMYWFTIYLTNFILLHSCSMITRRDEEYARQLGLLQKYANPESVAELQFGARMLLAHFHYVNKGDKPFQELMDSPTTQSFAQDADLTEEQTKFVRETARRVKAREAAIKRVQQAKDFSHDLYWVGQLYDTDWHPRKLE